MGAPIIFKIFFMSPTDKNFFLDEIQKTLKEFQENMLAKLRLELMYALRPANEVILDDVDLQSMLKVSKRHTIKLRKKKLIGYSQPIPDGKVHYSLSDVVEYFKNGYHPTISSQRKF